MALSLEQHDQVSAEIIRQFWGRVVKRTGDGILAVFELPASALKCAFGLQARLSRADIRIRAEVRAGKVDLSEEDVTRRTGPCGRLLEDKDGLVLTTEVVREVSRSGLE